MNTKRRELLQVVGVALSYFPARSLFAQTNDATIGNFRYIYRDPLYREEFKGFLTNVFHLYPEDDLHDLIADAVARDASDRAVYEELQARLEDIKPFLGDLRFSLPTLNKQKDVLADQTATLLGPEGQYDGYLELGTNGRFLDALEERLDIVGPTFTISDNGPTNSVTDILDRGQLFDAGEFVPFNDYRPDIAAAVPAHSLDLVTVYIGFHHCPVPLREEFIGSIRDALRPGGALVVRDHNALDEKMVRMVALAHDVFNMGTNQPWAVNERERRNFYSLATLDAMLTRAGFVSDGRRLFQQGDPTLNALLLYRKA